MPVDTSIQPGPVAFSFGGGVQSTACLVLAAQGRLDYKTFLFANVGDDSEHPTTMAYLRDVAIPYAEHHGLDVVELHRVLKDGSKAPTLLEAMAQDEKNIDIPIRGASGAPWKRQCTYDYKVGVVAKWMRAAGATKATPGEVGIGISLDEFQRMRDSAIPYLRNVYPLIDLRMTRVDCVNLIRDAGLPVPPKSSCWFCPFHSVSAWQDLHDREPDLFAKSVALERMLSERRVASGRTPVYLTRFGKPLSEVVTGEHQAQGALFTEASEGDWSCGPFTCPAASPSS